MRPVLVRIAAIVRNAAAVALILSVGAGSAQAACVYPSSYPGDTAPKDRIAAWMGGGARDAGLPAELPVMGGLVDSGLKNLPPGDSDNAGYFQMRVSIWDQGDYKGFPDHPSLQLQWFIDQAQKVRQQRVAAGDAAFGSDSSRWGEWVADVMRPAEQYRYRYQLRLDDARSLIASGCAAPDEGGQDGASPPESGGPPPGGGAAPDLQLLPESVLPVLRVTARRRQATRRTRALIVTATCANEDCYIRARANVAVPGRGIFTLPAPLRKVTKGRHESLRLPFTKRLQKLVASTERDACPRAVVRVIAANASGWRISASRSVRLCR